VNLGKLNIVKAVGRDENESLRNRRAPVPLGFEEDSVCTVGARLLDDGNFFGSPPAWVVTADSYQAINRGRESPLAEREEPVGWLSERILKNHRRVQ
jgi:hypothetical protein